MDRKVLFIVCAAALVLLAILLLRPIALPAAGGQGAPLPTAATDTLGPSTGSGGQGGDWQEINKPNVEKACLVLAKREAAAHGYSTAFVFSCSCSANELPEVKSYDCSVSALDGSHATNAVCRLAERSCQITSEVGTATYSFEELRTMFATQK